MKITNLLACLLLASAISLGFGGVLLYRYNLVPDYLIELTVVAIGILVILAVYVRRRNMIAINIATILGVIAPAFSLSTPAHVVVLLSFGQGFLTTILGGLQFLGFFIFPIAYVVLRLVYHNGISIENKVEKLSVNQQS